MEWSQVEAEEGVGFGRWVQRGNPRMLPARLAVMSPAAGRCRSPAFRARPRERASAPEVLSASRFQQGNRGAERPGPCPDGRRRPRAWAPAATRCKVKTQGSCYKTRRLSRQKTFRARVPRPPSRPRWPARGSWVFPPFGCGESWFCELGWERPSGEPAFGMDILAEVESNP